MHMLKLLSFFGVLWVVTSLGLAGDAAAVMKIAPSRLVFNDDSLAESLTLANSEKLPTVIQLWADDDDPQATPATLSTPLALVPSAFTLQPGESRNVTVMLLSRNQVPNDRERVWWLNVYQFPPDKQDLSSSASKMVQPLRIRLKVFVRPVGLAPMSRKEGKALIFSLIDREQGQQLKITNPTRYHMTLADLTVADKPLDASMIAPLSSTLISVKDLQAGMSVGWSTIDDHGRKNHFQHFL